MEHGNYGHFVTLLLLTNMLASIRVVQKVVSKYEENAASDRFKQAGIITGINQLLGGLFSAIGPVAISDQQVLLQRLIFINVSRLY